MGLPLLKEKIYYEPQDGWGTTEFYTLHRYLHRMLFYHEKYGDEINALDLSRMTDETKVLIGCIIRYYHTEFLLDRHSNLASLHDLKPLEHPLVIDTAPYLDDVAYREMNVVY